MSVANSIGLCQWVDGRGRKHGSFKRRSRGGLLPGSGADQWHACVGKCGSADLLRKRHHRACLLQLGVFGFGGGENGDVGVGVFPQREEILVGGAGFRASGAGVEALG
jgi:hypothetical protein